MSMVTAAEAMVGAAGVIVAIKVGIPRGKLLYGTTQLGQVLADPDLAALLDVTLRGRKLSNSFLLEVWLLNHNLWDITSRAFAGPIELNVQSAEIIEVVGIDMAPATPTAPAVVRHELRKLSIGLRIRLIPKSFATRHTMVRTLGWAWVCL